MKKIIVTGVILGFFLSVYEGYVIYNKLRAKPIYKIITSNIVTGEIKYNYYILYDNGKIKKYNEFTPSEIERYMFYNKLDFSELIKSNKKLFNIDLTNSYHKKINDYAHNIILLTKEVDSKSQLIFRQLYVINDKYLFTCTFSIGNVGNRKQNRKLFEYFPKENQIKEILNSKHSIEHIELYKED